MPATDFFGKRFRENFSDPRQKPSWANLGVSAPEGEQWNVTTAWESMGKYEVLRRPMSVAHAVAPTEENGGQEWRYEPSDYDMLCRLPTADDFEERYFGAVSKDYVSVSPQQIVDMAAECVRDFDGKQAPIETMGSMGHGEILFICWKLPQADIMGDAVDPLILLKAPFKPDSALFAGNVHVRPKCMNTLLAAIATASARFVVPHKGNPLGNLKHWLQGIYQHGVETSLIIEEAYNVMAQHQLNEVKVNWILNSVYPNPRRPLTTRRPDAEQIEKRYEATLKLAQENRSIIRELFDGAGTGMDTRAVKGTAYGIYNAAAEFEEWRNARKLQSAFAALLDGDRARQIEKAFSVAYDVATGQVEGLPV